MLTISQSPPSCQPLKKYSLPLLSLTCHLSTTSCMTHLDPFTISAVYAWPSPIRPSNQKFPSHEVVCSLKLRSSSPPPPMSQLWGNIPSSCRHIIHRTAPFGDLLPVRASAQTVKKVASSTDYLPLQRQVH